MEIGAALRQSVTSPDSVRPVRSVAPAAPPPPKADPPEAPSSTVSRELVEALAARTADNARSGSRIRVDQATDRVVVQILNADNEVIKQFPPEDLLRILERFREITGLLFDRQI